MKTFKNINYSTVDFTDFIEYLSVDYANTIKHQSVTKIIHGIIFTNYSFSVNNQVVVFGCYTKSRKTKSYDDFASCNEFFTDYGLLIFKKFMNLRVVC